MRYLLIVLCACATFAQAETLNKSDSLAAELARVEARTGVKLTDTSSAIPPGTISIETLKQTSPTTAALIADIKPSPGAEQSDFLEKALSAAIPAGFVVALTLFFMAKPWRRWSKKKG